MSPEREREQEGRGRGARPRPGRRRPPPSTRLTPRPGTPNWRSWGWWPDLFRTADGQAEAARLILADPRFPAIRTAVLAAPERVWADTHCLAAWLLVPGSLVG